jgi:hypothetical protein
MDLDIALKIMFVGMREGLFTGISLADRFSKTKERWLEARQIINAWSVRLWWRPTPKPITEASATRPAHEALSRHPFVLRDLGG